MVGLLPLAGGLRSFRLDRVMAVRLCEEHFDRPGDFDVLAHLADSMKQLPRKHAVEVLIRAPLHMVQLQLPRDAFFLEPSGDDSDAVLMRGRSDDLEWLAQHLARLSFAFEIREPQVLRDALREHARRLLAIAESV